MDSELLISNGRCLSLDQTNVAKNGVRLRTNIWLWNRRFIRGHRETILTNNVYNNNSYNLLSNSVLDAYHSLAMAGWQLGTLKKCLLFRVSGGRLL